MSSVNLAEVVGKLGGHEIPGQEAREWIGALGLEIAPFTPAMGQRAGELRPPLRAAGLSLGDRACLATAEILGLPVLTADRAWKDAPVNVEIRILR